MLATLVMPLALAPAWASPENPDANSAAEIEVETHSTPALYLNDIQCIVLSPVYVTYHIAAGWWWHQTEYATFFDKSARLSGLNRPSPPARVLAALAWPLHAVVTLPYNAVMHGAFGTYSVVHHAAELFTLPFGKSLEFYRLDGSNLEELKEKRKSRR